jgi:hypothetical protein
MSARVAVSGLEQLEVLVRLVVLDRRSWPRL